MGYEPFYILNELVQTLKRFKLWKAIDRQHGQEFAHKYAKPPETPW